MDYLYEEERKARFDGKKHDLERIHKQIIANCPDDNSIIAAMKYLVSKRLQDQQSIKNLIRILCDSNRSISFYRSLLKEIVEGKLYLEEERIVLAESLVEYYGENTEEAYSLIREIPAETFTGITETQRTNFLLLQMRLSILLEEYDDSLVFSTRIIKDRLDSESLKTYYGYMIMIEIGTKNYINVSQYYIRLSEEDDAEKNTVFGSFYCMMSSCILEDKNILSEKKTQLEELCKNKYNSPEMRRYVEMFLSDMLIENGTVEKILSIVSGLSCESPAANHQKPHAERKMDHYDISGLENIYRTELYSSVVEHNIYVIEKYVSRIHIEELSDILCIPEADTIDFLTEMSRKEFTFIQINQKDSLVVFHEKTRNGDVGPVLDKLARCRFLIHRSQFN